MNIEQLRNYCIAKKGVTESFPFDKTTLVFKVMNKMFLLTGLNSWENEDGKMNVKCDLEKALELRSEYESVQPGYHMSKKHWNTVGLASGEISDELAKEFVDDSYNLIVSGLTKKLKEELKNL